MSPSLSRLPRLYFHPLALTISLTVSFLLATFMAHPTVRSQLQGGADSWLLCLETPGPGLAHRSCSKPGWEPKSTPCSKQHRSLSCSLDATSQVYVPNIVPGPYGTQCPEALSSRLWSLDLNPLRSQSFLPSPPLSSLGWQVHL